MTTWMRRFGLSRLDVAVAAAVILVVLSVGWSMRTQSIRRQRTLEAANFLGEVHRCQTLHHQQHNRYADSLAALNLRMPPPTAFDLRPLQGDGEGWSLTAVEQGAGGRNPTRLTIDQGGWFGRDFEPNRRNSPASSMTLASGVSPTR